MRFEFTEKDKFLSYIVDNYIVLEFDRPDCKSTEIRPDSDILNTIPNYCTFSTYYYMWHTIPILHNGDRYLVVNKACIQDYVNSKIDDYLMSTVGYKPAADKKAKDKFLDSDTLSQAFVTQQTIIESITKRIEKLEESDKKQNSILSTVNSSLSTVSDYLDSLAKTSLLALDRIGSLETKGNDHV